MGITTNNIVNIFVVVLCSVILSSCDAGKIYGLNKSGSIRGEYLVKLKQTDPEKVNTYSAGVVAALGTRGRYERTYRIGNLNMLAVSSDDVDLIETLSDMEGVEYVEANQIVRAFATIPTETDAVTQPETDKKMQTTKEPNKVTQPDVSSTCTTHSGNDVTLGLWGHSRVNRRNRVGQETVRMYSYEENENGEGVDVYVLDTGVNVDHEDFQNRADPGFVSPGLNEDRADGNGHGTHVAGTVAGARFGLAKKATIISVKVLNTEGSGSSVDVLNGIEWAVKEYKTKGKKKSVCNLSLGIDGVIKSLDDAVDKAVDEGITFVVAAGNSAKDTCDVSPARAPKAIAVGATDRYDRLTYFSNWGKCVDILAPGANIESAHYTNNYGSRSLDGTSMACPHVAGAVARYLSSVTTNPTSTMVKNWLLSNATPNKINMTKQESGTPNKLLYLEPCHVESDLVPKYEEPPEGEPGSDGSNWIEQNWYYILAAGGAILVTIGVAVFKGIGSGCRSNFESKG